MNSGYPAGFVFGTGPTSREYLSYVCSMCCHEIKRTDQCAWHADCGKGAFHLECLKTCLKHKPVPRCPECHKPLVFGGTDAGQRIFTEKEPEAPTECQNLCTLTVTTRRQDPCESPSSSEADNSCTVSDLLKELRSKNTYISCAVSDLIKELESEATYLSCAFQPRDETTLVLTHPKIDERYPTPGPSQISPTSKALQAELDKLTDRIHAFCSNTRTKSSSAVDWVSPPTTCAIVTVNGRKAKIITGMVWLKLGEDHDNCAVHG